MSATPPDPSRVMVGAMVSGTTATAAAACPEAEAPLLPLLLSLLPPPPPPPPEPGPDKDNFASSTSAASHMPLKLQLSPVVAVTLAPSSGLQPRNARRRAHSDHKTPTCMGMQLEPRLHLRANVGNRS